MALDTGPAQPVRMVADEATSLGDMFLRRVALDAHRPAYFHKADGAWIRTTWGGFADSAARVAAGLIELGLEPGDRVAILGPTRPEWVVHDIGAQLAGCVSLGIYPKQSPDQVRYILEHSAARVLTVGDRQELAVALEAAAGLDSLEAIVPWDAAWLEDGDDPRLTDPAALAGEPLDAESIRGRLDARETDDAAIFVYTSGTTGPPKCAMITHGNILWMMRRAPEFQEFRSDDLSLSFLPMAHVAERILASYSRINIGFATAFASSIGAVLEELGEVQPTIFGSVPRIFEKAYARVRGELEKKPPAVRKLVAWAEKAGEARGERLRTGRPIPLGLRIKYAIAERLIFGKVKAAFGGRVRFSIVGAAPTPEAVMRFFWAAGLPLYEVYGQTEATVVTHVNRPGQARIGTVGQLVPGLEQTIADDGELLIRGPAVFGGYFRDPAATARAVVDGWLHTGDIAEIDRDGFVRITDRKKHIIITAGGKNLTPANIENAIKSADALIGHVHAHADGRKFVSALVVPGPLETLGYGLQRGWVDKATVDRLSAELIANPAARSDALSAAMAPIVERTEYRDRIRDAVRRGNQKLSQVERVKRFALLSHDFSQVGGELTPTMKIRRKAVEQKYADVLDRLYADDGFGIEP